MLCDLQSGSDHAGPVLQNTDGFPESSAEGVGAGCHAFLDRCNHLHQKDKEVIIACSFLPVVFFRGLVDIFTGLYFSIFIILNL